MTDGLVARPGIPEARPRLENISKAERRKRRSQGPATRLTQKLTDSFCLAISTSGNPSAACRYVGIDQSTMATWRRTADGSRKKTWRERSQMERMCLMFDDAVTKAEGEFQMRIYNTMARAGGMTRERPTKRIHRTVLRGGTQAQDGTVTGGEVVSQVVVVEEHPGDWRAAHAMGKMAFPEEMGEHLAPEQEAAVGSVITGQMVFDRLQAAKRVLAEREEAIDATATVTELGEGERPEPETR